MYKLLITITLLGLSGCASLGNLIPPSQQKAISLEPTELFADLKNLPKPVGSIPVSVYSFRDQTGQYKPQTNRKIKEERLYIPPPTSAAELLVNVQLVRVAMMEQ